MYSYNSEKVLTFVSYLTFGLLNNLPIIVLSFFLPFASNGWDA